MKGTTMRDAGLGKVGMKSKPNILFVNLPSIPFADILATFRNENLNQQSLSMPMGILYLSSYIKHNNEIGHLALLDYVLAMKDSASFDGLDDFLTKSISKIDFVPDIVAFSLIFSTAHKIFTICLDKLKSVWPDAVTIVGGVHATGCTKIILENSGIDYVVRGEGELAFSEFIRQYSNSEPIRVKGIYHKDQFDPSCFLEVCDFPENLDELPLPDYELIEMEQYINARGRKRELGEAKESKFATLITTRGCPFHCTFCASHAVHGRKVRFRTPENVAREVTYLNEHYGVTLIIPEDDMFTLPRERCLKMISALKSLKIPNFEIQAPSGLSVNTLDKEIMDTMIDANVKIFGIAIESGSNYVQKHVIKKNCDLKKARGIVKYLQSRNVLVRCHFVLGFFRETKEQMHETIEYAKTLGADWSVFMLAAPLVGSEMYSQMVGAGYIKEDMDFWSTACFQLRQFDTAEISAFELTDLVYRANLECNFINNPNRVQGHYEKAIELYENITAQYSFHIIAWYCIMECHRSLGNIELSERLEKNLQKLIKTDKRATAMYEKYSDLMSGFILRK
jgi:anaerobic magnesium-protoporphyrin IX monomethyl ester cyclase